MRSPKKPGFLLFALPLFASLAWASAWASGGGLQGFPRAATPTTPASVPAAGARALDTTPLPAGAGAKAVPLTPEQKALEAIREEARVQVQAIVAQIVNLPDSPARHDLMRRASEIKKQAEVRCLETKLAFAHERGDVVAIQEIETALDRMLHPTVRAIPPGTPGPVKGGAQ